MEYEYLDSGNQNKLEKFGDYILIRPCSQAVWKPLHPELWQKTHGKFTRDPVNQWKSSHKLPNFWFMRFQELVFKLMPTDFGHLGIFPEHAKVWEWVKTRVTSTDKILNLFAYTGGATLALAKAGASICHVDASKTTVAWARENAGLNQLEKAPIRWIVDDVTQFLRREVRRGHFYNGIILDPPTYGRGSKGEVFEIVKDLPEILQLCVQLLSSDAKFLILSSHTLGYTPLVLKHLLEQALVKRKGSIEIEEMTISGPLDLPCGSIARWAAKTS